MRLRVHPGYSLSGRFSSLTDPAIPGDKSISHRAALFAAIAEGESRISNFMVSGVTLPLLNAMTLLGVDWSLNEQELIVHSPGIAGWKAPREPVYCGNSATTLRLLTGAIAASGLPAMLDGSEGLRRRPMERIVEPLRLMGVPISAAPGGGAPLTLAKRPANTLLRGMEYALPVASAQVKTCLILAALAADSTLILHEPELSRDHTERMLARQGVNIASKLDPQSGKNSIYILPPGSKLEPLELAIPGDFSSGAFLIVAAAITPGSVLTLEYIGLNPTRTGLLDSLRAMGADIEIYNVEEQGGEQIGTIRIRHTGLIGTNVGGSLVVRMIDEFPIFSIAAATGKGATLISDATELRYKETDRITSLVSELQNLGIAVAERPDGMYFSGDSIPAGGEVFSHGDHRLAMSLAVAGSISRAPVTVLGAQIIHESFPQFSAILRAAGATIEELPD